MTVDDGPWTIRLLNNGPSSTVYGLEIKSSRPQWDGREFPVVPPTFIVLSEIEGRMLFALTNISLSYNVENTVQTTGRLFT
jgi:hypothetical protein